MQPESHNHPPHNASEVKPDPRRRSQTQAMDGKWKDRTHAKENVENRGIPKIKHLLPPPPHLVPVSVPVPWAGATTRSATRPPLSANPCVRACVPRPLAAQLSIARAHQRCMYCVSEASKRDFFFETKSCGQPGRSATATATATAAELTIGIRFRLWLCLPACVFRTSYFRYPPTEHEGILGSTKGRAKLKHSFLCVSGSLRSC
jgi:hypothetical protein